MHLRLLCSAGRVACRPVRLPVNTTTAGAAGAAARLYFFVPFVCCFNGYLYFFFPSSAVVALLQSPLVTSNAGAAEAACGVVANLADGNAENSTKFGTAGVCEGGYPAGWMFGSWARLVGSSACESACEQNYGCCCCCCCCCCYCYCCFCWTVFTLLLGGLCVFHFHPQPSRRCCSHPW